jgi:hypothetical protein
VSALVSKHLKEFFGHPAMMALAAMQHMKTPIWNFRGIW